MLQLCLALWGHLLWEKPGSVLGGHKSSPTEWPTCQRTEASCRHPHQLASCESRRGRASSPVEPSNTCGPGQELDCNLTKDLEWNCTAKSLPNSQPVENVR